jgi:hypothetical protein
MTVASCPSCREEVTIPADALPDSIVQCPLCGEEFRLSEFLTQIPPELIIKDPGQADSGPGFAWEKVAQQATESGPRGIDVTTGADESFAHESMDAAMASSSPGTTEFDFVSHPSHPAPERTESYRAEASRGAQKKPGWELFKIVAGALLALPLAQLILWWLPGTWQRDPFRLGPATGRVLPWIVPSNYRNDGSSAAFDGDESVPSNNAPMFEPRPYPEGRPDASAAGKLGGQRGFDPASGANVQPDPGIRSADSSAQAMVLDTVELGLRNSPEFSSADLQAAVEAATQASQRWDTRQNQPAQDRGAADIQLYSTLAELGRVISFVRPTDPGVREQAEQLFAFLRSFVQQPDKLAMIGNRSAVWVEQTDRTSDGVLLFGTVKQIRLRGQMFETELELASQQRRQVSVLSTVDPKSTYAIRSRILMLGVIVNDPQANLVGYEGDLPQAVLGAFPVTVLP